jgi:hypothetical protein
MATYYNKKKPNWESLFLSLSLSLSPTPDWKMPHILVEKKKLKKKFLRYKSSEKKMNPFTVKKN